MTGQTKSVIVAGGRDFEDYKKAKAYLDKVLERLLPNVIIVSGGAFGADRLGERYAEENGLVLEHFPAAWDDVEGKPPDQIARRKNGDLYWKVAGPVRNQQMADFADMLVVFWDGNSPGTADMIRRMIAAGKPFRICRYGNKSK